MIAIIDNIYNNLKSLSNALDLLNKPYKIIKVQDLSENFSHAIIPGVGHFSKAIEELKKEEKINNANKDTLLKYIQHIRVLKLRINNEILYKTKFSDVFNFSDDNDGTDQDIVSVLSNVDSAIKKKTDVINQLNILEKSLIDHYNYHKKLLDK